MEIGMIVVPPITITDAMLTSSIPEPDASVGEVVWNAATNYTAGTRVIRTTTHKIYERIGLAGVNAGLPEVTPLKWIEVGPTNRWAMFDNLRSSTTSITAPGTTVITLNLSGLSIRANAFALLNSNASSIQVQVYTSATLIYDHTYDLTQARYITSYYDYFFAEFRNKANIVDTDMPISINNTYTFTIITPTEGRIGGLVIGYSTFIGDVQVSPSIDQLNFSRIERDDFGTSILVPRRSIPKTSQKLFISKNEVNKIRKIRDTVNAVPAVWVGLEDSSDGYYDALLVFGVYKEFSFDMDYPDYALIQLDLEEV
jgi:hypothetical protein